MLERTVYAAIRSFRFRHRPRRVPRRAGRGLRISPGCWRREFVGFALERCFCQSGSSTPFGRKAGLSLCCIRARPFTNIAMNGSASPMTTIAAAHGRDLRTLGRTERFRQRPDRRSAETLHGAHLQLARRAGRPCPDQPTQRIPAGRGYVKGPCQFRAIPG
jgi:hypothetical protein